MHLLFIIDTQEKKICEQFLDLTNQIWLCRSLASLNADIL